MLKTLTNVNDFGVLSNEEKQFKASNRHAHLRRVVSGLDLFSEDLMRGFCAGRETEKQRISSPTVYEVP